MALTPVVCASSAAVARLAEVLVANRLAARPGMDAVPPEVLRVAELHPDGTLDPPPGDPPQATRELLVLATGGARAAAVRAFAAAPPPGRVTLLTDPAAAAALPPTATAAADHVAVVLGHREPGVSTEHRISKESLERIHRAELLVRRVPTRTVVLTGYTSTGGLSEAEQMALVWRDPLVPVLLEVAGRDTAENATRSLPLVLALGGVRRVSVVTSAWHVRAGYFFAPYRGRGLDVAVRREWRGGGWARLLADDVRKARWAPAERRRAWAAVR